MYAIRVLLYNKATSRCQTGSIQEHPELAYNEGFANYFYVMLQDHFDFNFFPWTTDSNFRSCNGSSCAAHTVGNENESRVSTFLYRYTKEIIERMDGITAQAAFGKVRSRLWNVGYYNVSFTIAWANWLLPTLPQYSFGKLATQRIAYDTYLTLAGAP